MTRHKCQYWKLNLRYHYRWCGFCGATEFDYGGKWTPERKLTYFIHRYSKLGACGGERDLDNYDVIIYTGRFFEFNAYEGWGAAIKVKIGDKIYGPYPNLNCAEYNIDLERNKVTLSETHKN